MDLISTLCVLVAIPCTPSENCLGDFNRRSAAAVATDLASLAELPQAAFDLAGPSILQILCEARPLALRIRAMQVYTARCSTAGVAPLTAHLNACLDAIVADPDPRKREIMSNFVIIEAFVSGDLAHWGPGLQGSSATSDFLMRVAKFSAYCLDQRVYHFAVDGLMHVLPNDSARRAALLEIIGEQAPAASTGGYDPAILSDAASRQALRQIAAQPGLNECAFRALSELGDIETLPIIQQKLDTIDPTHVSEIAALQQTRKRIELVHPPSCLIDYIRSPDSDSFTHWWAIKRASDLGLDGEEIRSAIIEWAASAPAYRVGAMKAYAFELGVLQSSDLSDAPPSYLKRFGTHVLQRSTAPVDIPDRRAKQDRWVPNQANYPAFGTWFNSVDWQSISDAQAVNMIHEKMCELSLLSPEICTNNDAPAQDGP